MGPDDDVARGERGGGGEAFAAQRHQEPDGASCAARMHRVLLYLEPRHAEEDYFSQLESLDLVNCIIAPIFFANALAMWQRGPLSLVYCLVLLIKGYQMGLLLLPSARRVQAHKRSRYWIILAERVLRQFLATPLLGSGPRFYDWYVQQAMDSPRGMTCIRILLLLSGFTISFWNAFCLPLDFVSQALINLVFLAIHFPCTVCQVAFAFQTLLEHAPQLLWLQLGLERALGAAAGLLRAAALAQPGGQAAAAAAAGATAALLGGSGLWEAPPPVDPLYHFPSDPAAAAVRPAPAPDTASAAGRLMVACSMGYMVFAVLLLPLYTAWLLERHLKSKWLCTRPYGGPAGGGPGSSGAGADAQGYGTGSGGDGSSRGGSSGGGGGGGGAGTARRGPAGPGRARWWARWRPRQPGGADAGAGTGGSTGSDPSFVYPPTVFDVVPPSGALLRHLALMAAAAAAAGEMFAFVLWLLPGLQALLRPQIVY